MVASFKCWDDQQASDQNYNLTTAKPQRQPLRLESELNLQVDGLGFPDDVSNVHGLESSILQIIGDDHLEARVGDELLSFGDIGALEPADDGLLHADVSSGVDDSRSNDVTFHDASEDIDKDGEHLLVSIQQLECLLHLVLTSSSSDIQEVGWVAAFELDNIHCGHSEASTVHHAADVASETNVVEVVLSCYHFSSILLTPVAELENGLLAELSVVVEVNLAVAHDDTAIRSLGQGVHFY